MKSIMGILALLLFASTACASEDYVVKTKIYDGDNLIGSPAMQVAPNKEAGAVVSAR